MSDQCMTCGGPLTNTHAKSLGQCGHCRLAYQKLYTQAELDAARANTEWLARHDAEVFHTTLDAIAHDGSELVVGGKEPVRVFSERELGRKLAETQTSTAREIGFAAASAGIAIQKLDDPEDWKRALAHLLEQREAEAYRRIRAEATMNTRREEPSEASYS